MKRTVRKPFLLLLVMLAVSGHFSRAYGQADNYKKQKNEFSKSDDFYYVKYKEKLAVSTIRIQ